MNILLVSQCDKRALTETRRILDQFAERRGDRTWQTPITRDGLDTLRKLLRKTARKNTAVACHWVRGLDHSELLWVVGDARRFNAEGAVPTNATTRDVLRSRDENDWDTAQDIRLLAQLAALLHDLGKASVAFQERLRSRRVERNLYRHEWVSLRLFQAFVGEDDDEGWLQRLADPDVFSEQDWMASGRYQRDGIDAADAYPFRHLPPLAAAVAWLVVTHHRLPVVPVRHDDGSQAWLGKRASRFEKVWLELPLWQVAHDWNEKRQVATPAQIERYWQPAGALPVVESKWRGQAARVAKKLLQRRSQRVENWLDNAYVMHLARLSLMLADHHYSSLPKDSPQRTKGDGNTELYANTDKGGTLRQPLDEHLIGVARDAGAIAHALPGFERHLPRLAHHRGLRKRSADARFSWQDKAVDAATAMRESACQHGAFIINMASTGCGKTLANARILYALADPQLGLRVSYALGLRTLTQQTGRSYRHDLQLNDDELAVLVGGSASRTLFEYHQAKAEAGGSASVQALIEEDSHVLYEGNGADHPLLSRALANPEIRKLISAPMLVCTIDHLAPATESLRAGRQIAPMLRLMSSDLVLDELDDYDLDDLPALTRLMHWAGLLGSRVVLSSATFAPALIEGIFMAYRAGRRHYQQNHGRDRGGDQLSLDVPCLWADEFGAQAETIADDDGFAINHARFVERRVARLRATEPLRLAALLPINITARQPERRHAEFADRVRHACLRLHREHAHADPVTGKRVSFGLVRMAHIDSIVDVAGALYAHAAPDDTRIHLCVYHARFPLVQRSAIEAMLDATFNRRDDAAVWRLSPIRRALDAHPEPDQLFVVLASPVCEVGRDWDADWALAEPSSMRSLIQLAGRVQRHRRQPPKTPNVLVFDTNLKGIGQRDGREPVFARPGFETERGNGRFLLTSHSLRLLLAEDEYRHLDAQPRIQPRTAELRPRERWVDLEHARIGAAMLPVPAVLRLERDYAPAAWQHPQAALTGVLPQQQPFRHDDMQTTTLVWRPNDDEDRLQPYRVEDVLAKRGDDPYVTAHVEDIPWQLAERVSCWGDFDLSALVTAQADAQDLPLDWAACKFTTVEVPSSDQGWRWHPSLGIVKRR